LCLREHLFENRLGCVETNFQHNLYPPSQYKTKIKFKAKTWKKPIQKVMKEINEGKAIYKKL